MGLQMQQQQGKHAQISYQPAAACLTSQHYTPKFREGCILLTRLWLQAPEDDDPTAHMVSGPSSSVPPSMRPSPTPSQIELSKVRCLALAAASSHPAWHLSILI